MQHDPTFHDEKWLNKGWYSQDFSSSQELLEWHWSTVSDRLHGSNSEFLFRVFQLPEGLDQGSKEFPVPQC